ncbi:hypothetical protein G6F35_018299 [Rhizopus arrhizus]|nr:hypothetical protein G6F31_019429 [Rhizopus arrhizus]KAG1166252.1 hypothetical protein G6F35_018299 [Rhizopus arrhizus]KAG1374890.1 hypothetical protein G6F59_018374 [Rhizopus arrhizus]
MARHARPACRFARRQRQPVRFPAGPGLAHRTAGPRLPAARGAGPRRALRRDVQPRWRRKPLPRAPR